MSFPYGPYVMRTGNFPFSGEIGRYTLQRTGKSLFLRGTETFFSNMRPFSTSLWTSWRSLIWRPANDIVTAVFTVLQGLRS